MTTILLCLGGAFGFCMVVFALLVLFCGVTAQRSTDRMIAARKEEDWGR